MSKKKATTTMTLKDFHGGSIPSELPLPSAPGASARPPDRAAAASRPDHLRPRHGPAASAASAAASAVERSPAFLSQPARIGCHFDEDERTPFDAPRRPQQTPPAAALRSDPKQQIAAAPAGAVPNAWAVRKEAGVGPTLAPTPAPAPTVWSASRIAEASAVGKVISGMWHSKPPPDLDVIRVHETGGSDSRSVGSPAEIERERPRSVGFSVGNWDPGRAKPPVNQDMTERGVDVFYNRGERPATHEGRFTAPQLSLEGPGEVSEHQKLNLLPRTKPLEPTEIRAFDDKQGYQLAVSSRQSESAHEAHGHGSATKADPAVGDEGSRAAERPRLSLKPRSQPGGQLDGIVGRERQSVFGGARPRELVLKERGLDVVSNDLDKTSPVSRQRSDLAKTEAKLDSTTNNSFSERAENFASSQRGLRNAERKDNRHDTNKADMQKTPWRNDNRKITKDNEKPLPEQPRPEPETWRKPAEQLKQDVSGPRLGKAATALELARAFSRSVSDSRPPSQLTNQGAVPNRNQMFSRLIDSKGIHSGPAQRKINGY